MLAEDKAHLLSFFGLNLLAVSAVCSFCQLSHFMLHCNFSICVVHTYFSCISQCVVERGGEQNVVAVCSKGWNSGQLFAVPLPEILGEAELKQTLESWTHESRKCLRNREKTMQLIAVANTRKTWLSCKRLERALSCLDLLMNKVWDVMGENTACSVWKSVFPTARADPAQTITACEITQFRLTVVSEVVL